MLRKCDKNLLIGLGIGTDIGLQSDVPLDYTRFRIEYKFKRFHHTQF
jgi:hypothetical protein